MSKKIETPQLAKERGMTVLVFEDDFDSLETIDVNNTGDKGYKWYVERLSPTSISIKWKKRATARKYMYNSSYSSNTIELYSSSSILAISFIIGSSPNSLFPAWIYSPFPAAATS